MNIRECYLIFQLNSLVKEPFPEPNISLPTSMMGSIAAVPLKNTASANVQEPTTHSPENKRAPTENIWSNSIVLLTILHFIDCHNL